MRVPILLSRYWSKRKESSTDPMSEAAARPQPSANDSPARSTSAEPSANHAPTEPTENRSIGERAAALVLSHQSWVRRRVESVQFLPGGETRHHISFDLAIPEELTISGQEIGASENNSLIAAPLTYMRKGALVDLDVSGADGTALPSVGAEENGRITVAALQWLVDRLPRLEELPSGSDLEKDLHRVVYSTSTFDDINFSSTRPIIVNSKSASLNDKRDRCFRALLSSLIDEKDPPAVNDAHLELAHLGVYLSTQISAHLADPTPPTEDDNNERADNRTVLASLLMLLSTVSTSYAFTILAPRTAVTSRTIIKVSFDTDIPNNLRKKKGSVAPKVEQYSIYIPTRAAKSTHIDLRPADGTELLALSAHRMGRAPHKPLSVKAMGPNIHINAGRPSETPITGLAVSMWCTHRSLIPVRIGSVLSSLLCIFSFVISLLRVNISSKFFTADSVLAILALVVGLWAATIFDIGRHRLTQDINKPILCRIIVLAVAVTLSLLSIAAATDHQGEFQTEGVLTGDVHWNTWSATIPMLFTFLCAIICIKIAVQVCLWALDRKKQFKTMDEIHEKGCLILPTNAAAASTSNNDRIDAAEVAAFECVVDLPEDGSSQALECVEQVCHHIWEQHSCASTEADH